MTIDSDREKVLGENFIPLSSGAPLLPEGKDEAPSEPAADPVKEEEVTAPPTEEVKEDVIEEDVKESEEEKKEEEVEEEEEKAPEKTVDEEAEEIIREILGEEEEEKKEGEKKEGEEVEEKEGEEDKEPDAKQQVEDMKLEIEQKDMKLSTITSAYKKLLSEKNNIEAINEEYTQKLQIISDNPLMQDLLRGLYLQGKDASAVTNVEATLKDLLKEHASIDVDELVEKARGASASKMSPGGGEAMVGANQVYEGLLGEGDMVPLS